MTVHLNSFILGPHVLFMALMLMAGVQVEAQKTYTLKSNEVAGKLTQKNGKELVGYIRLNGSEISPWKNQKSVEFFAEDALADGKVKGKEVLKFKPKDIQGYEFDDRKFVSMEISESKVTSGIGMGKKTMLLEEMAVGKITMYRLYSTPEPLIGLVTEEERVAHEEEKEQIRNQPCMVLVKEGMDLKCAENIDLRDFIGDCEEVKGRYEGGHYGVEPTNPDAQTKLGKFIANSSTASLMRSVVGDIIDDYNSMCN